MTALWLAYVACRSGVASDATSVSELTEQMRVEGEVVVLELANDACPSNVGLVQPIAVVPADRVDVLTAEVPLRARWASARGTAVASPVNGWEALAVSDLPWGNGVRVRSTHVRDAACAWVPFASPLDVPLDLPQGSVPAVELLRGFGRTWQGKGGVKTLFVRPDVLTWSQAIALDVGPDTTWRTLLVDLGTALASQGERHLVWTLNGAFNHTEEYILHIDVIGDLPRRSVADPGLHGG